MLNIEAQKDDIIKALNVLKDFECSNALKLGTALFMTVRKNDRVTVDANDVLEWLLKKVEEN